MRTILTLVLIAACVYIGISILVYVFQSRLIFFPERTIYTDPSAIGLDFEDVTLTTGDDIELHGWHITVPDARGTMIFCHGNAGNISHRLESIRIFTRLKLNILIFDYRGFGRSEGHPDEQGTYRDARAAWDYLTRTRRVDPGRIIIFGRSLGSAVAAHLASETDPAGLIIESSFTSLPELAGRLYAFLPVGILLKYSYPTAEKIAVITCPKLIIHSEEDELIPFDLGRKNFETAAEPKEFLTIRGSHNDGFLVSRHIYQPAVQRFFDQYMDWD